MKKKQNCWEFMKCGRGPDDQREEGKETCPVAAATEADGLAGGVNGGRLCWVVADTCCRHLIKCSDTHHESSCFSCEFRYKVQVEEGLLNLCKATGLFIQVVEKQLN